MPSKICPICKETKDYSKFRLNEDGSIRGNDCTSCRSKKERAQLKLSFLNHYVSGCTCCGEKDPRFLTLDHINNDGNVHRKNLKEHQIMRMARNENWPEDKYTCLCFNCNSGRSANGGVCPHQCITIVEYVQKLADFDYRMGKQFVNTNTTNLPAARAKLKNVRNVKKLLSNYTQEQIDAIVASLE